ncbi:hypothetical protein V6N11_055356 [Hibiscus sabdariffa]|uniref:Uncharacterized protein n=1 Tax=Hibiscus sabdariffa TaxID=183260 RepID=A0ABR2PF56_9ROSI
MKSTRRGRPFRRRVQPIRFIEPLNDVHVDPIVPVHTHALVGPIVSVDHVVSLDRSTFVNLSASVDSSVSVNPSAPRGPPVLTDLPIAPHYDLMTVARGVSISSFGPMIGVVE